MLFSYLIPKFIVSATPIIEIPRSILLHILAAFNKETFITGLLELSKRYKSLTKPCPFSPTCTIFFPMSCRTGLAASKLSFDFVPTINVSVPAAAPTVPPDTGASLNEACFSSHILAISFDASMSIVLQSMQTVDFLSVLMNRTSKNGDKFQIRLTTIMIFKIILTTEYHLC